MTEKERFERRFNEWADNDGGITFAAVSIIDRGVLRTICGTFYFHGAHDATEDARKILAEGVR